MPFVTLYFELHQPLRLNPDVNKFFWEEKNAELFINLADTSYLPALQMFCEIIRQNPTFKICLSLSGTFIRQAEMYGPDVISLLHQLLDAGREHNQVELVEQTFHHSYASLFDDVEKKEFREQVIILRQKLRSLFGIEPVSFHDTDLLYTNDLAELVADMGYKAMLCSSPDLTPACPAVPAVVSPEKTNPDQPSLIALPIHKQLSSALASGFSKQKITARKYANEIACIKTEAILLGLDLLHIGHRFQPSTGIFHFWRRLPEALMEHPRIQMANPAELAEKFSNRDTLPVIDIPSHGFESPAEARSLTAGRIVNQTQLTLLKDIQSMEADVKTAGGELLEKWRFLTTSDHICYLHEDRLSTTTTHHYANPYGSTAAAAYLLTRNIDKMRAAVASFNIRKKSQKTPVIIVTPETYRLPTEGMGFFGKYVSGKSGGLGEVVSCLCKGLVEREIPVHFVTLNLRRRFREEARLSEEEWINTRHSINPENIHLVTSAIFEEYSSAYDGDPIITAAEFQRQIINVHLREIRCRYDGRAVLHTHDWMAGGTLSAYARIRGVPTLHTVHNTHTAYIPLDKLQGINLAKLWPDLSLAWDNGLRCVDAQATAIKASDRISYVGRRFLQEIVDGYFADRWIIAPGVRDETKNKYRQNKASVVFNGISPEVFPQNQAENPDIFMPGLARKFGPDDNVIQAKKDNLVKFQKKTGLNINPEAIMLYWPSRLDPTQKGVELLEAIAANFIKAHPDVQIAVVGNPVGNGRYHADVMGAIACSSDGRIAYQPFNDDLSVLGYAAASDVFGASLYEPFGQIDVVGNLYGATATNRDTGGYTDKIIPLSLKAWGSPQDHGNGVLFKTYDAPGLWWALSRTVENHRWFRKNQDEWEKQAKRIMTEAARKWSLENMIAAYITIYEQLNNNLPLI